MNYYAKLLEEKRNDSQVIERGTIKGVKYFIEKITGYKKSVYRGNLEKDGRVVTTTWTCDSIDECKREINKLRDTDALLNNSKDEKENSTVLRGTIHGHKYEVDRMSDGSYMGYVYDEEDFPIFKTSLHSTAAGAEKEIKGKVFNSKEEKENENFHYLGKTFSVTSGNFQQVRQQVQKAYWDKVKELEVKLRSAKGAEEQRIQKELREIREGYKETMEEFDRFNNSKEEKGYYAQLIEKRNADDRPFTKKQECLSTLDRIISLAQRKKSQVQGWRTLDDDFDENEFASDLKEALRAVENIIG